MIKTSIEKLANSIGFDIANSDSQVQADLINGLCEGLANSMQKDSLEKQICYIVDELSPKTNKVLKAFVEFIELKENE